jgi:predicted 2-oxoglutarate/Fe(II)-dependent dioxygenase YbiX
LVNIYNDTKNPLKECIADYEKRYNLQLNYMEAINFIRYGVNQHFQVHTDHGFSYTATTSSCMYLNDDYEGGELWFPYLDLSFKPEYGDIVLFPSTYIYAHAAKPVLSGVKYSAVTMFDYNDNNHDLTRQASYSQEKNY